MVLRTSSNKEQLKRNLKVPENYGHRKVGKIDRIEETKRKCKKDIHTSIKIDILHMGNMVLYVKN